MCNIIAVKQSVFADVMLGSVRFAENRVVLLAAKLAFDAVFDNELFHKFIFLSSKSLINTDFFGSSGTYFDRLTYRH